MKFAEAWLSKPAVGIMPGVAVSMCLQRPGSTSNMIILTCRATDWSQPVGERRKFNTWRDARSRQGSKGPSRWSTATEITRLTRPYNRSAVQAHLQAVVGVLGHVHTVHGRAKPALQVTETNDTKVSRQTASECKLDLAG
jgi:hypothetical protein